MILVATAMIAMQSSLPIQNLVEVPFTEVTITDKFWAPKRDTNRTVSIPHSFRMLHESGTVGNFELAAKGARTGFRGFVFMDSDLYKAIEAASYSLATNSDPALERQIDELIELMTKAQMPDGYLNTYYQVNEPDKRFTNLGWNHELYCAGHMFEAAVAHFKATGKKNLLNVAMKYADLLCKTFGTGPGQRMGYCGHPEIELALFKLWRATGQQKYFDLAKFFLESRGSMFFADEMNVAKDKYDGTYYQDDMPLCDQRVIKGHAVRAGYLLAGTADMVAVTKDPKYLAMLDRVWKNTVYKKLYITGGIGPSASNEGFTTDYDLPNRSAYQETCASVAMILWNHRMGLLTGESRYWDYVERSLYNGFLSGVSLDGKKFFYVNPLSSDGGHHRSDWFGCACCPPNVTRTLAALGQYAYAKSGDKVFVNLFIQGSMKTKLKSGVVSLDVQTDYPWSGVVRIKPKQTGSNETKIAIRIPHWSTGANVTVNGQSSEAKSESGYAVLRKRWDDGDEITLDFNMQAQRIEANPNVAENAGKTALQYGPIIYCLEQADNGEAMRSCFFPASGAIAVKNRSDLLGGVLTLKLDGLKVSEPEWDSELYQVAAKTEPVKLMAIPYYAWDNRAPGQMDVWIRTSPPVPPVGGLEMRAKVSLSFTSGNCQPNAIHDGKPVVKSNIHPGELCHFWPHKGTEEWVQYSWSKSREIEGVRVFWFDDTGYGECRFPEKWRVQYLDGTTWKDVEGAEFSVKADEYCTAKFKPVPTTALRLIVKLKEGWSVGIHEWQVIESEG